MPSSDHVAFCRRFFLAVSRRSACYTRKSVQKWFLLLAAAALCGCTFDPAWYPVPPQREFRPELEPFAVGPRISMSSPQADNYILSGVITREQGAAWRWTAEKMELRFHLTDPRDRVFFMDLVISGEVLRQTGPQSLRFSIDGRQFGSVTYDTHGQKRYETRVPDHLIRTDQPLILTAEVDKYFQSPTDGAKLGFLLVGAGFQR